MAPSAARGECWLVTNRALVTFEGGEYNPAVLGLMTVMELVMSHEASMPSIGDLGIGGDP